MRAFRFLAWMGAAFLPLLTARAQAPLGPAFTYQGSLKNGGGAANGTYNLSFTLWNAASGGSAIGVADNEASTGVSDGLFTVQLNDAGQFGASAFNGEARWLQISVNGTPLSPRQPLTATPYAQGLRLPYEASASVQNGAPFHCTNAFTGPLFTAYGLWGETVHPAGRGLYGLANTATGASTGVYGEAVSNQGIGVFGFAPATTLGPTPSYGVSGRSSGPLGRGVFGYADSSTGTNFGVYGKTASDTGYAGYFMGGRNYFEGSVGIGADDPSLGKLAVVGSDYGVYGRATSTSSGAGVHGNGKYGVLGIANSTAGFGGVFSGAGSFGSGNSLWATGIARIGDSLSVGGASLSATPAARLHIENGLDASLSGGGFAVLGDTAGANVVIDNNEIMCRNNGSPATLFLNNDGGNVNLIANGTWAVGIGTSSPAYTLDVDGAIRPRGGIYFNGALPPYQNAQGGNFLSFGHPGLSEDHVWYYNNNFFFYDSPGGGDAAHPNISADDFYTYSDIRLKSDVRPLTNALATVRQLRGIRYRFDPSKVDPNATIDPSKPSRTRIGFAAQEVECVVPEVVNYSPELDIYSVSYASLVPLLVESIKEQQAQIESLQSEIAALKTIHTNGETTR